MPTKLKWNQPGAKWNSGLRWNQVFPDQPDELAVNQQHAQKGSTSMEYWEVTKERAQITLPIWQTYTPTLKIGTLGHADLNTMIGGYEALVQDRTTAQDDFDEAERQVARSLLIMK